MITEADLCSPVTAVLRDIEAQALEAQAKGQQFICLTAVHGYLPNKEVCDTVLLSKGYAIKYGTLGWGSYIKILGGSPK
jgi:hypothetical protein